MSSFQKFKDAKAGKIPEITEKIQRDAFLYFDPHANSDEEEFAQCSTCRMFVPGDRCIVHGSKVKVEATGSCGLYAIWPKGKANPIVIGDHRAELDKGIPGSVTTKESGYVNRKVRCDNCEFFDGEESDCELYENLNKTLPQLFDLDVNVKEDGCCNANTAKE